MLPILPFVIDLHHPEPERLQFLRRKRRQLDRGLRVPRLTVPVRIPGAIHRRPRAQLDMVLPLHGVRVKFLADPRVSKDADRQGFQRGRSPRQNPQPAVVDLRLKPHRALFDAGKQHAAAPVLREPAGHHPLPRRRVRARQKQLAARNFLR